MIISSVEMPEAPNHGHMTTSTIQFELRDKFLLVTSWTEIMMSKPLFQNTFILRSPRQPILLISPELQPCLLKQPLKTQKS